MGQVYSYEHAEATVANLVYPISDLDGLTPIGGVTERGFTHDSLESTPVLALEEVV